jgi:hypothetical protein
MKFISGGSGFTEVALKYFTVGSLVCVYTKSLSWFYKQNIHNLPEKKFYILYLGTADGGTVVKVLRYKSEGR